MIDYGQRILFDSVDVVDNEVLRAWRNHWAVWRYCRQHDLISRDQQDRWAEAIHSPGIDCAMYAVVNRETKRAVGVAGLTHIDLLNRHAEFSLYIGPEHRGRGFANAALKTLVSHGFNAWGLEHIWGESYEHNPARQLFTAVGFSLHGFRPKFYFREGRFVDAYLYGMLREHWETLPTFLDARQPK